MDPFKGTQLRKLGHPAGARDAQLEGFRAFFLAGALAKKSTWGGGFRL